MASGILDFILKQLGNQWRDSYRDEHVLIYEVPLRSGWMGTKSEKLLHKAVWRVIQKIKTRTTV